MVRLGSYPDVSGLIARQKAAELLDDASKGKNPIISRQERKQAELDANQKYL